MLKKSLMSIVAVLVLSISALSATAGAATFTSESSKTTLSVAHSGFVIKTDNGEIKCSGGSYSGQAEGKAFESFPATSFFSGCSAFGFVTMIYPHGCTWRFYANGSLELVCPAGQVFEFATAYNTCNVKIPPQIISSINYSNGSSGGKGDITGEVNLVNLKYEEKGFEFEENMFCLGSGKETSNGELLGKLTITGKDGSGNLTGISWDA